MQVHLADLMRAIDDLERVGRKIFDNFEPLWDDEERLFKRALALLHEHVRELNQREPLT